MRTFYIVAVMDVTTPAPRPLTVQVASWEYACCRTPPAVGAPVSGLLFAYPAATHSIAHHVTAWDRGRELVVVDGVAARWDPSHGDPFSQPIAVRLSWHDDGAPGVAVTATAIETVSDPLTTADACHSGDIDVTMTDLTLVEPTAKQVAAFRVQQQIRRRTVYVIAAATFFGSTTLHCGDRITIDIADPAVAVRNGPPGEHGLVTGTITDVKVAIPRGVFTALTSVEPGTPAATIGHHLHVTFVTDDPSRQP
ncbi:hypothetical protein [Williamsia sterculiae]|uniref:Uncharacterized protein n=1 Tax=Williamsia sterculiae TaxID=1344003 RepID=A0A1N7H133_9NOCA|nr:hypothetical protein [Williamsia sterculiae]SIS18532.1 hypothetical protein SAMN05445060_3345 [Williamsia sterculiae]